VTTERILELAGRWGVVALTVVVAILVYRGVRRFLAALASRDHLREAMARRLSGLVGWAAFVFVLLVGLQLSGAFAHAWAVLSAALAALAVGFVALWSVLSNAVCALLILAQRPFRLGDRVEFADAPAGAAPLGGTVVDLGFMFTTLSESDDGASRLLRVPNSLFFQKAFRCLPQPDGGPDSFFFRRP
jgi:small-conductance mechanosensitive channel